MAITIYPTTDYDSFVSVAEANTFISQYTLFTTQWSALTDEQKEVYLRIATQRILNVVDGTLLEEDTCLKSSCAVMAVRDLVFNISAGVNENKGLITKEKVGDVEVNYYQGNSSKVSSLNKNPFSTEVKKCLAKYGAIFNDGFKMFTLERA